MASTSLPVFDWLRLWWPVLSGIGLTALGLALLYLRQQFPTRAEFHELRNAGDERGARAEQATAAIERRLVHVEHQIAEMPTKESIHRLELALRDMQGDIRELAADLKPVAETTRRMNEFLLEEARSR